MLGHRVLAASWILAALGPAAPDTASAAVAITEIMYHPDSDRELEEFIELANLGPGDVELGGWRFVAGVDFTFPPASALGPEERLVLCRDPAAFQAVHPGVPCIGPWGGELSNAGERLTLVDSAGALADTVAYADDEPWSPRADGDGQSLECIAPALDNDTPLNWRASAWGIPGTPGAPNSVAQPTLPPLLTQLTQDPLSPTPGATVAVHVRVAGDAAAVLLHVDDLAPIAMNDRGEGADLAPGDGLWSGSFSAPACGQRARWHVEARSALGAVSRAPEYAPIERRGFFLPPLDEPVDLPVWRLWFAPGEFEAIRADPLSDTLHPAGLSVGGEYFEPVWVRPRGFISRGFPKLSWKIFLPEWQAFEGEQTFNLNAEYPDLTLMRELIATRIFERAGYPISRAEPVRLIIDGEYQGLHVRVENVGKRWLERRGLSPDADLFAARRGMFQPADMAVLQRRWEREIDATGDAGWDQLLATVAMIHDTSLDDAAWTQALSDDFALERLLDYLAVRACAQTFDDKNKNIYLHRATTPDGERWVIYPYDLDLSLGRMFLPSEPDPLLNNLLVTDLPALWAGFPPDDENALYRRLASIPDLRLEVLRRVGRLLETEFRLAVLGPEIDALHTRILSAALEDPLRRGPDEAVLGGAEELKTFVRLRRAALAAEVPSELLPVTPERLADHLLGLEPLVGNEVVAADLNRDSRLDVSDLVRAAGETQW